MQSVLVVVLVAIAMWVVERWRPGVHQPTSLEWIARAAALNAAQVGVVHLGASSWDLWLPDLRLVDGSVLGSAGGVAVGYLAITFVFYWWHRARHEVPLLWRMLHQVHHSPIRLELLTAFYKHPAEILLNGIIASTMLHALLGLPAHVVAAVVAITGVAELVYHWNVRTPRWLGYLFQRPESHRRHHEAGWHRSNYSDLPLWDMLFGTFENPVEVPARCGFADGAERRLGRLLLGRAPR
jgi:sterol desaturase/sphingolipid hydroxylase (fatty acid hydroxylase superfamily)